MYISKQWLPSCMFGGVLLVHFLCDLRVLGTSKSYNDCSRHSLSPPIDVPKWSGKIEDFFDDYRKLSDIDSYIDALRSLYDSLVVVKSIGKTFEGRNLRVLEISDAVGVTPLSQRPLIYLQGGIHAREWIAPAAVLFIATSLLLSAPSQILQQYVFSVLPVANPDGYEYTWNVDRMWRKNRDNVSTCTQENARHAGGGVDLNRNFGFAWRVTESASYASEMADPCSQVFAGPRAFSESESSSIAEYLQLRQTKSFAASRRQSKDDVSYGLGYVCAFVDYHSWGQLLLPPWSYKTEFPQDHEFQTHMTGNMTEAINKYNSLKVYRAGSNIFPSDPGTSPDWAYGMLGVRASMTVELDPAMGGFCLPSNQIKHVGAEQWEAIKALVAFLDEKGHEPSAYIGPWTRISSFAILSAQIQLGHIVVFILELLT